MEGGFAWCVFAPAIRGRAFVAQGAATPEAAAAAAASYKPGQPVQAAVLSCDCKKHALDVSLDGSAAAAPEPAPGSVAVGRVMAVGGGGVRVQVSPRSTGTVALTDIHDAPVANALQGLEVGQYVAAFVLPGAGATGSSGAGAKKKGAGTASDAKAAGGPALSLRPSRGGACAAHAAAAPAPEAAGAAGDGADGADGGGEAPSAPPESLKASDLTPGQRVGGYVKSSGSAGVFVGLARGLDARIQLAHLADGFVKSPVAAFPVGAWVAGKVLKVEGER